MHWSNLSKHTLSLNGSKTFVFLLFNHNTKLYFLFYFPQPCGRCSFFVIKKHSNLLAWNWIEISQQGTSVVLFSRKGWLVVAVNNRPITVWFISSIIIRRNSRCNCKIQRQTKARENQCEFLKESKYCREIWGLPKIESCIHIYQMGNYLKVSNSYRSNSFNWHLNKSLLL